MAHAPHYVSECCGAGMPRSGGRRARPDFCRRVCAMRIDSLSAGRDELRVFVRARSGGILWVMSVRLDPSRFLMMICEYVYVRQLACYWAARGVRVWSLRKVAMSNRMSWRVGARCLSGLWTVSGRSLDAMGVV